MLVAFNHDHISTLFVVNIMLTICSSGIVSNYIMMSDWAESASFVVYDFSSLLPRKCLCASCRSCHDLVMDADSVDFADVQPSIINVFILSILFMFHLVISVHSLFKPDHPEGVREVLCKVSFFLIMRFS